MNGLAQLTSCYEMHKFVLCSKEILDSAKLPSFSDFNFFFLDCTLNNTVCEGHLIGDYCE